MLYIVERFVNEVMLYPFAIVPMYLYMQTCLLQKIIIIAFGYFVYFRATLVVCSSKRPSNHHRL